MGTAREELLGLGLGMGMGAVKRSRRGLTGLPRRIKLPSLSTPALSATRFRVLNLPSYPDLTGGGTKKHRVFSDQAHNLFYKTAKRVSNPIRDYRDWTWACDLFFPVRVGRVVPVFCAIEITSRLGFACITKRDAASTVACLDKLRKAVGSARVKHFAFDLGAEFDNASVKRWVSAQCGGEAPWYYDSGSSSQKGRIERFNFTVRAALELYKYDVSPFWTDNTLDAVCDVYNDKPHSGMKGATPNDAAGASEESQLLRGLMRVAATKAGEPYKKALAAFKPGDSVRVAKALDPALSPKQQAAALLSHSFGPRWSSDVYTVDKVGSQSPGGGGAGKAAGWYITLVGVGNSSDQGARRFSPQNLLKVDAAEAPAAPTTKRAASFKTLAAKAKDDARVARFLRAAELDEAAASHSKASAAAHHQQEAALRAAFADDDEAGFASAAATANPRLARFLAAASKDGAAAKSKASSSSTFSAREAALLAKGREALKTFFTTKQGRVMRQAIVQQQAATRSTRSSAAASSAASSSSAAAAPPAPALRKSARLAR